MWELRMSSEDTLDQVAAQSQPFEDTVSVVLRTDALGRSSLVQQVAHVSALQIDADSTVELEPDDGGHPAIPCPSLIENHPFTRGTRLHVLLHVEGGAIQDLEIYREGTAPGIRFEPGRLGVTTL